MGWCNTALEIVRQGVQCRLYLCGGYPFGLNLEVKQAEATLALKGAHLDPPPIWRHTYVSAFGFRYHHPAFLTGAQADGERTACRNLDAWIDGSFDPLAVFSTDMVMTGH